MHRYALLIGAVALERSAELVVSKRNLDWSRAHGGVEFGGRTLGRRWNTRVIVVPGAPRVTTGPYRYLTHPNYVAVVAEGAALPLMHTAWITAIAFSVLNAALLRTRIKVENAALKSLT